MMFFIKKISLPLQCVFHSIRFKVNKVGVQRYSFFYAHTSSTTLFPHTKHTLPVAFLQANFPLQKNTFYTSIFIPSYGNRQPSGSLALASS